MDELIYKYRSKILTINVLLTNDMDFKDMIIFQTKRDCYKNIVKELKSLHKPSLALDKKKR